MRIPFVVFVINLSIACCIIINEEISKYMKNFFSFLVLMLTMAALSAQADIVPAGGDVSNSNGSVSYTIGQVATQFSTDGTHSVLEGVQQPYEIQTVGIDDYPGITLEAVIYPNPTNDFVQLSIQGYEIPADGLTAHLYDANGKLLEAFKISDKETRFDLSRYATAIYQLRIQEGARHLKTFKVVKNNL